VLEVAAVDQHGLVVVVGRIGRRRQAADRRRRRGGGHGEGHGVGGLRVLVGDEQGPVAGSVAVVERQAQLAAGDERGRFVLIGDAIGIVEGDRGAVLEVAAVDQHGLVVVVGRIGRRRQAADRRRRRGGGHGEGHGVGGLRVLVGDEQGPVAGSVAVVERQAQLAAGDERGRFVLIGDAIGIVEGDRGAVLEVAAVDQHGLVVVVGRIGRRRQAADRRRRRGGGHGEGHGVGGLRVLVGDEQGPVAGSVAVVERQAQLAAGDERGRFVLIGDAIGIVEGDRGAVLEVAAVDQHGLVVVVGRIGRRRQAADRRRRRGGGHGEGHGVGGLRVLVGDEQGPVAGSVAVVERQAQLAAGDERGRFVLIGDAIGIVEGDRGAVLEVAAVDQHGLVVVVGRIGRRRQAADRRRRRGGGHGEGHGVGGLRVLVGDEQGPVAGSVAVVERQAQLAAGDERGRFVLIGDAIGIVEGDRGAVLEVA